jgi:hypothetical protein
LCSAQVGRAEVYEPPVAEPRAGAISGEERLTGRSLAATAPLCPAAGAHPFVASSHASLLAGVRSYGGIHRASLHPMAEGKYIEGEGRMRGLVEAPPQPERKKEAARR